LTAREPRRAKAVRPRAAVSVSARVRTALVLGVGLGAAGTPWACSVPTETPELVLLTPAQAHSDVPVGVRVETRHLRPAVRVDAQGGGQSPDLRSVRMRLLPQGAAPGSDSIALEVLRWNLADLYWVRVPAGVPAGPYALELTDAHGATAALWGAFAGLGPDTTPPTIEVRNLPDGATIGSGNTITAAVVADDGAGQLDNVRWQVLDRVEQECFTAPPFDAPGAAAATASIPEVVPSSIRCPAKLMAPVLGDGEPTVLSTSLRVWARDLAGNEATRDFPLQVAKKPIVDSFAGRLGALGGRQPFTVRGRFFIPGTEALVGGVPIIGSVLTTHDDGRAVISGWTPPRGRAEPVGVEVRSLAGIERADEVFTYLPPPRPRDIQPPTGPTGGGVRVTVRGNDLRVGSVVVYVGASREVRLPLYNVTFDVDNKVVGCVPPGTGTVSVWAYDPLTGDGELPMSFTYQDPPAGAPPPAIDASCVPR
jgi:hypothetical protein